MLVATMSLLDLLLPPACAGCGRSGSLLCDTCLDALGPPSASEDRFAATDPGIVVGEALRLALAAFAYEGPVRRALAALKYTGASRLAPVLAEATVARLSILLAISGRASLVPVPVHRDRLGTRGYNQAELIARGLARRTGLPVGLALERVRPTTQQHRLNRVARLHNLRGAFAATARPPPVVILVDDIITTTATLEACASVLRDGGSYAVYGVAIAREV
jgi:ComF family protein